MRKLSELTGVLADVHPRYPLAMEYRNGQFVHSVEVIAMALNFLSKDMSGRIKAATSMRLDALDRSILGTLI